MTDLPKYHSLPPLTPHKRTTVEIQESVDAKRNELAAMLNAYEPTPTIPQMEDQHERQIFTHKAERVVNQVLAFALTVLAVVFVGGLMYKAFVWGY